MTKADAGPGAELCGKAICPCNAGYLYCNASKGHSYQCSYTTTITTGAAHVSESYERRIKELERQLAQLQKLPDEFERKMQHADTEHWRSCVKILVRDLREALRGDGVRP